MPLRVCEMCGEVLSTYRFLLKHHGVDTTVQETHQPSYLPGLPSSSGYVGSMPPNPRSTRFPRGRRIRVERKATVLTNNHLVRLGPPLSDVISSSSRITRKCRASFCETKGRHDAFFVSPRPSPPLHLGRRKPGVGHFYSGA